MRRVQAANCISQSLNACPTSKLLKLAYAAVSRHLHTNSRTQGLVIRATVLL